LNCPSCRRGLPAGPNDRCPFCGSRLSAPVEGALAAEPAPTPDPRDPQAPIREIPGLRKRERTWKDEVRERVRDRRERRSAELPLFPGEGEPEAEPESPFLAHEEVAPEPEPLPEPEPAPRSAALESLLVTDPEGDLAGPRELGEPEVGDLYLHPASEPAAEPPARAEVAPVERPALPIERLMAGLIDLAVLVSLWAAVVYFSSRVARVPLSGLWPAWPWLLAYLAALGLLYAGYFTGTTGQTLGKMAQRLHVLHLSGGPPGHARAVARALIGSLGVLLAAGGLLPMLFDPARRALHDRLLKTRVIRL
jgi:uncharacterized RDD family membrane protein YckC